MAKHKSKKRSRGRPQKSPTPSPQPTFNPGQNNTALWKRLPAKVWTFMAALIAVLGLVGLYAAYPSLSMSQDYTFDAHNPYNTSFSVTNEGYLTAHNLTAVCISNFEYMPPPDAKIRLGVLTTTTPSTLFAESLPFKERASVPCNHNVAANGHPLMPGATLEITVDYHFLGFHKLKTFKLYAVLWWDNTYRWEYGTAHEQAGSFITLSGSHVTTM